MVRAREGLGGSLLTAKGKGEKGIIGMMGRRQVTPGWADDPVRRQDGHRWRGCRGMRGMPPLEEHQTEGGEGSAVQE